MEQNLEAWSSRDNRRINKTMRCLTVALATAVCFATAPCAKSAEPYAGTLDLTAGEGPSLETIEHDWNLGPTGARGWMEGEHDESVRSRQILITTVAQGAPAAGHLQAGDVILGIDDKPFDRDARRAFGEAITAAESEAGRGRLTLLRWRKGETLPVTINLPVLGTYSKTTPWDCPKTGKILEKACAYLVRTKIFTEIQPGDGHANIAALALLATGDPAHESLAKSYVYKLLGAMESAKGKPPIWGYAAWGWGYGNLLMTEYYLLTGDEAVLPAIRRYSDLLAEGQSGAGSWGHRMSMPNHGPCHGYGAMNQSGTICWMSLILAKRCGVTSPAIEQAIRRGHDYLSTFMGRQPIPYGDHISLRPDAHDDNGKSSAAACAYALLGDTEGTAFHSRMTVASYAVREVGHTGSFWSSLWGPLGASRAGKEACGAFLSELSWLYDLERRWDGGFVYQGQVGVARAPKWDTTAARILMYCLPRKRLCITGRDALTVAIPTEEIAAVIEAGRPSPKGNKHAAQRFDGRPTQELLTLLENWSPVTRYHAARSLAAEKASTAAMVVPLLNSDNPYARYGACQALRELGPRGAEAVPQLIDLLTSQDRQLQIYAIAALGASGDERAVAPLLELAGINDEGGRSSIIPRMVARALFGKQGLLKKSIADVDRAQLYPAVRGILRCNGGHERSMMAEAVLKKLTPEELQPLWSALVPALRDMAPSGVMFASGVRLAVARIFAENKVEEGMELILGYMQSQKPHASRKRNEEIMKQLTRYGASAKPLIPAIEKYIEFCRIDRPWTDIGQPPLDSFYKSQIPHLENAIKSIRESDRKPELISIKAFMTAE